MTHSSSGDLLGAQDVAEVLQNVASLMEDLHRSDVALQNALSSLAKGTDTAPTLFELQHVDLLTQSHYDVAKLMIVLADWARGKPIKRDDLRAALTLRSLQDALIDAHTLQEDTVAAGELSLF